MPFFKCSGAASRRRIVEAATNASDASLSAIKLFTLWSASENEGVGDGVGVDNAVAVLQFVGSPSDGGGDTESVASILS